MMTDSVQQLFSERSAVHPDRIAIEWNGTGTSYAELECRSNQVARFLAGTRTGTPVGIMAADPVIFISAVIGTLKAGCAFVPLESTLPERRLRSMLGVVQPQWFIADEAHAAKLMALAGATSSEATIAVAGNVDLPGDAPIRVISLETMDVAPMTMKSYDPDQLCYIYFTSGSTGDPKGIAGRLKSITHFIRWEIKTFAFDESVRVAQLTSPSFDAYMRDIFTPLSIGGTICVPPDRDILLDPMRLMDWLIAERIAVIHTVPTVFRALLGTAPSKGSLPDLREVLLSGEPLLPADVGRWFATFGNRARLTNLYGPSETTMTKLFHRVEPADAERPCIPIGRPMDGARAMVFDTKGQPCGIGMIGEIYIRTPYRSLGYYRQPELTHGVFVPNPLGDDPNDIVYRTGDIGRVLPDGNLEYLGRRDQQVKIRGVRVELAEVENALRHHDSVRDVAVVDREGEDGSKYLAAYVVLMPRVEPEELRRFLADYLPAGIIPTFFMELDILPRTISGKVDRNALPLPTDLEARKRVEYVAPRTPTEHALAAIWEELLQIGTPGIHHNFFTIGGHSLLAMQVITRVESAFGIPLALRNFLEQPTIATLAEKVDEEILRLSSSADELLDVIEGIDEEEARTILAVEEQSEAGESSDG